MKFSMVVLFFAFVLASCKTTSSEADLQAALDANEVFKLVASAPVNARPLGCLCRQYNTEFKLEYYFFSGSRGQKSLLSTQGSFADCHSERKNYSQCKLYTLKAGT